jgi:hypothetical protein
MKAQNPAVPEPQIGWQKTPVANLVRYNPSGIYFARVRVRGKLIRQSRKTDVFSVAQLRLADLVKEQRQRAETQEASARGKMTFGDALTIYEQQLKDAQHLRINSPLTEVSCRAARSIQPGRF